MSAKKKRESRQIELNAVNGFYSSPFFALGRKRKDYIFSCICALFCSSFVLVVLILLGGLVQDGYTAFLQTRIYVGVSGDPHAYIRESSGILLTDEQISDVLCTHCAKTGWIQTSGAVDSYYKVHFIRENTNFVGRLDPDQISLINYLQAKGEIKVRFNSNLFTKGDSPYPEKAGILTSIIGSLMIVVIAVFCVFPVGIIAGIYIGEFGRKSLIAVIVELSAKNLASVPSVVIGMFGLSVYVGMLGLPRSSALVGGLTLGILALPLITLTTKQALSTVPGAIKYSALALGASPLQVLWRHSLPMSIPIIITGFILSIARIIGETAPLLVVGMVIFVRDVPKSLSDSVTTLPAQVYLWAKNPLFGFEELASAAVLVLILIVVLLNLGSSYIRKIYTVKHEI